MLDTKEIERRLKDDIEVKLECIDTLGFTKDHNDANREILDSGLFVESVDSGSIYIKGCGYNIIKSEYEYFRIKEESPHIEDNPTFNDLIDVAMKAWKDGYLKVLEFERDDGEQIFTVIGEDELRWLEGDSDYRYAVDLINSLYTETFVIESESDTNRLISGGKTVLKNGEVLEFSHNDKGYLWFNFNEYEGEIFPFVALKGATVTQKRGK